MHTRQEINTGTLTRALSVLQELKDGNYTPAPNQRNLSSLQNEGSAPHPWSSSIDRHPRSGSDVSLSKRVSLSRDESHISATSHVSNADMGYTPRASSIDEDYGTHPQGQGRYQEESYSHAQNDVHSAETEAEYDVTRYRSGHESMGSSHVRAILVRGMLVNAMKGVDQG